MVVKHEWAWDTADALEHLYSLLSLTVQFEGVGLHVAGMLLITLQIRKANDLKLFQDLEYTGLSISGSWLVGPSKALHSSFCDSWNIDQKMSVIPWNSLNQCLAKTGTSSLVYLKITHNKRFYRSSQNLEFGWPCLIFIIQAGSIEVKVLGSSLVLIIQAVDGWVKTSLKLHIPEQKEKLGTAWDGWWLHWYLCSRVSLVQEAGDVWGQ